MSDLNQELPISSMSRRISSFVIDDLIVSLFFLVIFYDQLMGMFANTTEVDETTILIFNDFIAQNVFIILSMKIIYHTFFIWQNGATVGKQIMRLRVISLDTQYTPTFQKSFLRAVVRVPSESLLYAGFIMAYFMPLNQTLHDKLSNCVVVDA